MPIAVFKSKFIVLFITIFGTLSSPVPSSHHQTDATELPRRLRRACELGSGKGSPYSTAERTVPELIPVLGSQPAGDMSHEPGGRLPLLPVRPAVTIATLKRAATNFAAW